MTKSKSPIIKLIPDFLDYIDVEKGLSPKTQENYARFLKRFENWLSFKKMTNLLPHELTKEIIWKYRIFLARQTTSRQTKVNLSKKTQNFYLIALRSLLSYFVEKDIISLPPDKISLAKQEKNSSVHFLSLDKIKKLLDSPSVKNIQGLRDKAILETLFSSGMRVSELVALNRNEVSVKKNTDKVFELPIRGKGNKTRTIYFSIRAVKAIRAYVAERKDLDPALFVNFAVIKKDATSRRLTTRSVERIVKKYVKLAGLHLKTTPHTLRHSFATDLLNNGVDLRLVQEFLGHSDISTTQIYTHVTSKKLSDVYNKFHAKSS